jgi:hypothetical protein
MALLAGLRGAPYGRRAMFTLPAAWLLGSLFGLSAVSTGAGLLGASLWFLAMGGLVVVDAKLSLRSLTGLGALLGGVHGYLNGTGLVHPYRRSSRFSLAAVFVLVVSPPLRRRCKPMGANRGAYWRLDPQTDC